MGKDEGGVYPPHFQYNLQLGFFLTALVRDKELASPFVLDMGFFHILSESFDFLNYAGFLVAKRM